MNRGKKAKKEKNNILLIIGLLLLIVAVGVGYATIQANMNIIGTANIGTNTWSVYFSNVQTTTGSVTANPAPTVMGTSTLSLGYTITLDKPGDFYEFTVDVVNGGTLDAALQSKSLVGAEDYDFIKYTVTKSDGTPVPSDLVLDGGDGIDPGESITLRVRVEYDEEEATASTLEQTYPALSLTYQMVFVQA